MRLEQHHEEQPHRQGAHSLPGIRTEQLEAGLEADHAWRAERRAKWERRLRRLDGVDGQLNSLRLWLWVLFGVSWPLGCVPVFAPEGWAFGYVPIGFFLAAALGVPLLAAITIPVCRWLRRRVLAAALRDGIDLDGKLGSE